MMDSRILFYFICLSGHGFVGCQEEEPDTTEIPEIMESAIEPDAVEPDAVEPDAIEPDAIEPDAEPEEPEISPVAASEPEVPKPLEIAEAHAAGQCERIVESPLPDDDAYFQFHQNDERLDPNQFVKVVFKIISGYNGQYVKKVTLDYSPQVRSR